MTIDVEQPVRRRRPADQVRQLALECARRLLLQHGPSAITLQAVAGQLGMTHGNVTHHFGSANGLQGALAEAMIRDLVDAVQAALAGLRAGETDVRDVIDLVFDAFDAGGAGQLIAWLASSGHRDRLVPLCLTVAELATTLEHPAVDQQAEARRVGRIISAVIVPALGAALLGRELAGALLLGDDAFRVLATDQISTIGEEQPPTL